MTDHDFDDQHEHEHHEHDHDGPLAELVTVRDWLRYAVTRMNAADVHFGHGCTNAFDEAAWLILSSLHLPLDRLDPFLDACITGDERPLLLERIERRVVERVPTAYLLGESWLNGVRFAVDERVIIPRSFFAELLADGLAPWLADPDGVEQALDLCTGSGCLAVLMADAFPNAAVTAVDLSSDACAVAAGNIAAHGLEDRITLVQSDLFDGLGKQRFDLIVSNPPYVTSAAMATLPPEYRHEPALALAAGDDGLDVVRSLIAQARRHLTADGHLFVEIGHNRDLVDQAFPDLPLLWLSTEHADAMIFMLHARDLPDVE